MKLNLHVRAVDRKECIEFGMVCIGVLQVVYLFLGNMELIYTSIGVSVVILTLPRALYPATYAWHLLSALLNAIGPAVMLTAVFVLVVIPVAFLRRLFGRDIMRRREFGKGSTTAMDHRNIRFTAGDFKKMY